MRMFFGMYGDCLGLDERYGSLSCSTVATRATIIFAQCVVLSLRDQRSGSGQSLKRLFLCFSSRVSSVA